MTTMTNIQDAIRNLAGTVSTEIGGNEAHLLVLAADCLDAACAAETAFAGMGAGDGGTGAGFYDLVRGWDANDMPRHQSRLGVTFRTNCGEVYAAAEAPTAGSVNC